MNNLSALLCFSHLRWNFVWQRPQHLITRFAQNMPVYYFEEPVYSDVKDVSLTSSSGGKNITILVPEIPATFRPRERILAQKMLINNYIMANDISDYASWYYTPMAYEFSDELSPAITVYDCMDELSAFQSAPESMRLNEKNLMKAADVVFTGGYSIYNAKKKLHPSIYPFPSSIDKVHFGRARTITQEPADQKDISGPRIGFIGVIDERFDIGLVRSTAAARPNWQFVLIGPVVKIDPATLPQADNIHYLGSKKYEELPSYIAGWNVAMIPFALNESTKFISPTKTPEYLAAGKPVISTGITDVITPYGDHGLVSIIQDSSSFIEAAEKYLAGYSAEEIAEADEFLKSTSWDKTWRDMTNIMATKTREKIQPVKIKQTQAA